MFVIHSLAFDMAHLRAPVHSVHMLSFAIAVLILATILSKSQARYYVVSQHNSIVITLMCCSHICYGSVTAQGSYVAYNQQPRYYQYSYTVSCGGWWSSSRCTRYGSRLDCVTPF